MHAVLPRDRERAARDLSRQGRDRAVTQTPTYENEHENFGAQEAKRDGMGTTLRCIGPAIPQARAELIGQMPFEVARARCSA